VARRLSLALAVSLALVPSASAAQPEVPVGFLGVNAGGGTLLERGDLEREYGVMLGAGVQTARQPFQWDHSQPYATWADVPPDQAARFRDEGGVPTDWTFIDRQVAAATRRRIEVLAVVHGPPDWAQRYPGRFSSPPRDPEEFARFLATLARRYGRDGAFWREHPELPKVPVTDWQIWNEPSLDIFWADRPWVPGYIALLRASRLALREVDPRARIVLAGFPNASWVELDSIYREGGGRMFDVVAVHPFTSSVDGVLKIIRKARSVMARNRDRRKPIMVTETSWTSSKGRTSDKVSWKVTESGQARKVRELLIKLARNRRSLGIEGVYWFTWMTEDRDPGYSFDYAGLRRQRGADAKPVSKPALKAYRRVALALSGCRGKAARADRCAR
jgi:hypothetical protein